MLSILHSHFKNHGITDNTKVKHYGIQSLILAGTRVQNTGGLFYLDEMEVPTALVTDLTISSSS